MVVSLQSHKYMFLINVTALDCILLLVVVGIVRAVLKPLNETRIDYSYLVGVIFCSMLRLQCSQLLSIHSAFDQSEYAFGHWLVVLMIMATAHLSFLIISSLLC